MSDAVWIMNIEPCCNEMANVIMMNDIRQGVIRDPDRGLYLLWADGDCTPLRFCPCCGKRIELRKSGGVHNKEMFSRTMGSQITDRGWDILAKSMEREKNGKFGSFRPEWEEMNE